MKPIVYFLIAATSSLLLLTACGDTSRSRVASGTALGAGSGAIIGSFSGNAGTGALIGAGVSSKCGCAGYRN